MINERINNPKSPKSHVKKYLNNLKYGLQTQKIIFNKIWLYEF